MSGLFVVAMSLFGVGGLYWLVRRFTEVPVEHIPLLIVGYGFGASFVALFAQLGGGIYTKAADVGADLVGKVEAGIPEDDPRNPAVIADLVGDNVGDCAGRGADLFESTAAENIGAMILGATLAASLGKQNMAFSAGVVGVMLFPLVARAFGLLASIVGIFRRAHPRGRGPDEGLEPRLLRGCVAGDRRLLRRDQVAPRQSRSPRCLVDVLPVRHDRSADIDRLRLHHAVLHGIQVPTRAGDRRGFADGPGH